MELSQDENDDALLELDEKGNLILPARRHAIDEITAAKPKQPHNATEIATLPRFPRDWHLPEQVAARR
jgi:hypothetical protein